MLVLELFTKSSMHKGIPHFTNLKEAIEEAYKFSDGTDFPGVVTLEEDGLYTLYGHGKRVYVAYGESDDLDYLLRKPD